MAARKPDNESRQLVHWEPLVVRAVDRAMKKPSLAHVLGDVQDMRQIARMAVLQAVRSPKFADAKNQSAYLGRVIYNKLVDASRRSALIRIPDHNTVAELMRAKRAGESDQSTARAQRAMRVASLNETCWILAAEEDSDPSPASLQAATDVVWAIERLPEVLGMIMGHLFGVAGYDKLAPVDIARRLGWRTSTVLRKASEGRRMLRNLLKDCGYTEVADG